MRKMRTYWQEPATCPYTGDDKSEKGPILDQFEKPRHIEFERGQKVVRVKDE